MIYWVRAFFFLEPNRTEPNQRDRQADTERGAEKTTKGEGEAKTVTREKRLRNREKLYDLI